MLSKPSKYVFLVHLGHHREKLISQPEYRPVDITKDMQTQFGAQIDYFKAWRAKEEALLKINDSHESAYNLLPKCCADLQEANSGSLIIVKCTEENKFKRVFMSLSISAEGFAHCRPLLHLDGIHLKSKY